MMAGSANQLVNQAAKGTPVITKGSMKRVKMIAVVMPIIMPSITAAMSLLSQWSCSSRSVPIFSKAFDVAAHLKRFSLFYLLSYLCLLYDVAERDLCFGSERSSN